MTEKGLSELLNELELWIGRISKEPPAEIYKLDNAPSIPGSHRYGFVITANSKLRELSDFLMLLQRSAVDERALKTVLSITNSLLEHVTIFTDCFGLDRTTELFKKVIIGLKDVQTPSDYKKVITRLRVYIDKLAHVGWIDTLFIHASEMELFYDLMFPPRER